jgi:hypothetical protein
MQYPKLRPLLPSYVSMSEYVIDGSGGDLSLPDVGGIIFRLHVIKTIQKG